jgi:hypothetical protein
MNTKVDRSPRIRELNDSLRRTFLGGKVMLTAGVDALPPEFKACVLSKVRDFNEFSTDNDPHGEHDFGAFEINNEKFFWKIDYYTLDIEGSSEDPANPAVSTRVLSIMYASEY